MTFSKSIANDLATSMNYFQTPYHFVKNAKKLLKEKDFQKLNLKNLPQSSPKKGYFVREGKVIIAYSIGGFDSAFIIGSHCDSPSLIIETNSDFNTIFHQIKIQHYSSGLAYSWFGRDLRLVGSILVKKNQKLKRIIINDYKPIAFIPPPIKYNAKDSMDRTCAFSPIFGKVGSEKVKDYVAKIASVDPNEIISMDLRLADAHPPEIINDLISSGRLDDVSCAYTSLKSFIESEPLDHVSIVAIFNNEEIGSTSFTGAKSDMLSKILHFICNRNNINYEAFKSKSFLLSADNDHAAHPNFGYSADLKHTCYLGTGVIVKTFAPRSSSSDEIGRLIVFLANRASHSNISVFSKKNMPGGGGTIGPKMESFLGIRTIDIGIGQLAMHSVREVCSVQDVQWLYQLLQNLFSSYSSYQIQFHENTCSDSV